jgi:transposase
MAADQERDDDETSAPEPQPGIQGESGSGRHQGREDVGRVGAAIRRSRQSDHANQITQWKAQLLGGAAGIFGSEAKAGAAVPTVDLKSLHAKIGELTLENDFLEGALSKVGMLSAKR